MTLDSPTNNLPPLGTVLTDEQDPRGKPRQPGDLSLRLVIVAFLLLAILTTLCTLTDLASGTIDLVNLVRAPLAIIATVGLFNRSDTGRKAGIALLWISLALNALALIVVLVIAIGTATGLMERSYEGSIILGILYLAVTSAVGIWMLTVMKSDKIIAQMKTNTMSASAEPEHRRATRQR